MEPKSFQILQRFLNHLNIEELYYKFFDISTPENRFLSNRLVRLLNLLVEKKIDLSVFNQEITRIRRMSYQEEQAEALTSVQNLAQEIVSNNNLDESN